MPSAAAAPASAPPPPESDLRLLNAVAEALGGEADVRAALERTLALVAERLGLRAGWVWLLDPESDQFYSGATYDLPPYLREPVRMTGKSCWCIEAFRAGRLAPGNVELMQCSRLRDAVAAGEGEAAAGLRVHATIPLTFRGRPLGILNLAAPEWRTLTARELGLLSTVAYQVGMAVERARLAEEESRLARVEERTRLAREIHDTLAQNLAGIALQIEGALGQMERDPARARDRLGRALTLAREGLDEARRSVLSLRAAPLADMPLPKALRTLARRVSAETGLRVTVRADTAPPLLTPRAETELYRIAQEALANVRRHATGATRVNITLDMTKDGRRAILTIADDGPGFTRFAAGSDGSGQGIPGMRERARALGGGLRVTGRAGRGVRITAWAPLPGQASSEEAP